MRKLSLIVMAVIALLISNVAAIQVSPANVSGGQVVEDQIEFFNEVVNEGDMEPQKSVRVELFDAAGQKRAVLEFGMNPGESVTVPLVPEVAGGAIRFRVRNNGPGKNKLRARGIKERRVFYESMTELEPMRETSGDIPIPR